MSTSSTPGNLATLKPPWYAPTPAKTLIAVLLMQGALFLSSQYRWFWFNESKGYTVLITVAATAIALLLLGACVWISRFTRWKAQFSLATLLLMIPVMAIPCAWLAREIELARRQRSIVNAMKLRRCILRWDRRPVAPPCLVSALGMDFFEDIDSLECKECFAFGDEDLEPAKELLRLNSIDLSHTQVTDVGLSHVKVLSLLYHLDLTGLTITDAGLESLSHLRKLSLLQLQSTQITDKGMKYVGGLDELEGLDLEKTHITSVGLGHVSGLKQLKSLYLRQTKITDDGLVSIDGLHQLENLDLSETQITGAGLVHLSRLTQLKFLRLDRTKVTDEGLDFLADLSQLEELSLSHTEITDEGVMALEGLASLQRVNLFETKVTWAARERLKLAMPNCRIH